MSKSWYIYHWMYFVGNILMAKGNTYSRYLFLSRYFAILTMESVKRHSPCATYSHHSFKSNLWGNKIMFQCNGLLVMASLTFLVRYLLSARSNLSAWGGLWWLWYPGKVCTWVKILWNSLKSGCIIRWMVQLTCPPENFEMPERVARSQCWLKSKFSFLKFPKLWGYF